MQMKLTTLCKKGIMGLTGLIFVLFLIAHLLGNLTVLMGADAFNGYAHFLMSLGHGIVIYVAEAGLIIFFIAHVVTGIQTALLNRRSRTEKYVVLNDAGGTSKKTFASRTMIYSGILLLVYIIYHINHFKYGAGIDEGYTTVVHGENVRDLYRLVVEEFNKPLIAFVYAAAMGFLFFHVRHGFWSAFQSLGIGSQKLTPLLNVIGLVLACLLVFGFVLLPLFILFFISPQDAVAGVSQGAGL